MAIDENFYPAGYIADILDDEKHAPFRKKVADKLRELATRVEDPKKYKKNLKKLGKYTQKIMSLVYFVNEL